MKKRDARKTVRTFALASFLNDMGSDMVFPIWPLFVTSVLGANMAILGLLDGLGEALVSFSQMASGYASDRLRRRKVFIWPGYLLGALSRIGYGLSTAWQHLVPFRVMDRLGKMRGAPRDAIVADVSTKKHRGRNFGFLRAMDHAGAVTGVVITILFFGTLGYRKIFMLAAIPTLVGALLIVILIKERRRSGTRLYKGLRLRDLDNNFRLFLLLSALFALGSFSYSFLLIFARDYGFGLTVVPVLYLVFALAASLFSIPFGRLADRIGRKRVLAISFALWAAVCGSFVLLQSHLAIFVTFVLYGAHRGAFEPVSKTFVSELAPDCYRASCLGTFQMVVGLCALPASIVAGVLWDRINDFAPFLLSLALTLVSVALLLFVKDRGGVSRRA
jgi:MFS family permease